MLLKAFILNSNHSVQKNNYLLFNLFMKIQQIAFQADQWQNITQTKEFNPLKANLVLAFGDRKCLEKIEPYQYIRNLYPSADIVINSTSGEIFNDLVHNHTIIVTAIEFEKTIIRTTQVDIHHHLESGSAGEYMAKNLLSDDLSAIFIISDGSNVNGSALISSLIEKTNNMTFISGGLAGDETRFEKTLVGLNENAQSGKIVGIGFYGNSLKVGNGTKSGWEGFGPEREVTKSECNILYRINDRAALDIYREYLGKYAIDLPGTALLLPLSLRISDEDEPLIRTILSIDEINKSMTFAGNMPEGSSVRFMKANLDRIIDASAKAASNSAELFDSPPELAILISCAGRKMVLGQRTDEEIETARDIFGNKTIITGFYSYGEICPQSSHSHCELQNQSMAITTFSEN